LGNFKKNKFLSLFACLYKGFVEAFIKIGLVAGKAFALTAEIHLFFLVAAAVCRVQRRAVLE
jgi:hypothetical protein